MLPRAYSARHFESQPATVFNPQVNTDLLLLTATKTFRKVSYLMFCPSSRDKYKINLLSGLLMARAEAAYEFIRLGDLLRYGLTQKASPFHSCWRCKWIHVFYDSVR